MTIEAIQNEIIEEFSRFEDWMQRYEYMIELGKSLPLIAEQYKTDDYLIKGCQSQVWLHADYQEGIVALLVRVYSGHTPEEILAAKTDFIDQIGLKEHLSPTRANGLVSMLEQMRRYALLQAKK